MEDVIELYNISIEYKIEDLQESCEKYLSNSLNLQNFVNFYNQYLTKENNEKLKELLTEFMVENMELITKDNLLDKFDKKFLINILKERRKYVKKLKKNKFDYNKYLPNESDEDDSDSEIEDDSSSEDDSSDSN